MSGVGGAGRIVGRDTGEDNAANRLAGEYFRATRAVLNGAWLRPHWAGLLPSQNAAGQVMAQFTAGPLRSTETLEEPNVLLAGVRARADGDA